MTALGFEVSLTRYFAIASWSEYGYWVISIAMVGLSASGVVLSLSREFFIKRSAALLSLIPPCLMLFAAVGFFFTTINPFNPLELQNPELLTDQLFNIGKYYAALFPFFFATGLYIGLCFISFQDEIPLIYAADLAGAGAGAIVILVLMFVVSPFHLLSSMLVFAAAASFLNPLQGRIRPFFFGAVVVLFIACELFGFAFNRAGFNEYKAIYPALHVEGNRVVSEIKSPRGHYMTLDNFTERLDTDFSNNARLLGAASPPASYGLYSDGNRVASLPKSVFHDMSYVKAALDSFPYQMLSYPDTLLIGTRGGFRIKEAQALKASRVVALEPDRTLFDIVSRQNLRDVTLLESSPASVAAFGEKFDLIDISSDFLGQSEANKFAFTVEAVETYLASLDDGGIVSLPVSIREFTVYAVKLTETVRTALKNSGVERPERHVIIYRSNWNARILVSKRPFTPEAIRLLKKFCDERSFDTSYFPGIVPSKLSVWNDLPLVSFEDSAIVSPSDMAVDALAYEAGQVLSGGRGFLDNHFFNLAPATNDRPFFHSILRPGKLGSILDKISIIPKEEIGYLVNVVVLGQAVFFGLVVLALPLVRLKRGAGVEGAATSMPVLKPAIYFSSLGLGFLFMEIFLIEKASFFLNDRTYGFAVVLSGMLVFSGIGSYFAGLYTGRPNRGVLIALSVVAIWSIAAFFALDAVLLALINASFPVKCVVATAVAAPLALALGLPFPIGLSTLRGRGAGFLPWAWGLNGAFSVIATPSANLIAVAFGYKILLWLSLALYIIIYLSLPRLIHAGAGPAARER